MTRDESDQFEATDRVAVQRIAEASSFDDLDAGGRRVETFVLERDDDSGEISGEEEIILSPDRLAFDSQAEDSRCGFIPGYSILGSIGRGGMGVVYQAIQERLQRVVALKVLTPPTDHGDEFVTRFEREAMAVARLNHPNVVTAYDYGEADGKFYLAIEYVEGMDAAQLLEEEGRIREADAIAMARDVVLGLSHALTHGIIHRDIKPANLMMTSEANRDASGGALSGRLKVTDLGLAQIREQAGDLDADKIVGTPCYMAPEQSRAQPTDFRGDIYALGATLYHLVTGVKPHEDGNPYEVIKKKHEQDLVHPQDIVPELTDGFCAVLDRMMARKRRERHQSYEELLMDLQGLLLGRRMMLPERPRSSSIAKRKRRTLGAVFSKRRGEVTPLPFRLREIAIPGSKRKDLGRKILSFILPALVGFGLAWLLL